MSDKLPEAGSLPLPVIDFADFGDGTTPVSTSTSDTIAELTCTLYYYYSIQEALGIAKKLIEACQGVGFAYLINIGIPQSEVDNIFDWACHLSCDEVLSRIYVCATESEVLCSPTSNQAASTPPERGMESQRIQWSKSIRPSSRDANVDMVP